MTAETCCSGKSAAASSSGKNGFDKRSMTTTNVKKFKKDLGG